MSDSEGTGSDVKKRRGENYEVFQRSKKMYRSPVKQDKEGNVQDVAVICRQMLEEIKQVRKDQSEMRKEMESGNNEMRALREEIKATNERWEKKYKEMENKFKNLEKRVENLENEKRKNNIIVTGLDMEGKNEEWKKQMEEWINTELGVENKVKEVIEIVPKKYLVKMQNFEEKLGILKNKNKLKGKRIYIDSDLTPREREVQKKLRREMRKLKEEGKVVKIGHMKLIVGGKEMLWNEEEGTIKEKSSKN